MNNITNVTITTVVKEKMKFDGHEFFLSKDSSTLSHSQKHWSTFLVLFLEFLYSQQFAMGEKVTVIYLCFFVW